MAKLKFIDLFAGLGGFHIGLERLGHKCVYACEIDKHLNEIYQKEICISPIKSLSLHLTNVNSSYGLAPFVDYKDLWIENNI